MNTTAPQPISDKSESQTASTVVSQMVVVVSADCYWGKGESLEDAIKQAQRAGSCGVQKLVIYIYTGPKERLEDIGVNSYGDIVYHLDCTSNRVGAIKVNMSQKITKP